MTDAAPQSPAETPSPLPVMRRSRELAVQLLYQVDLGGSGLTPDLLGDFFTQAREAEPFSEMRPRDYAKLQRLASEMVREVWQKHRQLDELLTKHSANWTLTRMAAVDRNILRLALFELLHCGEIPSAVTINEAVELAKTFGDQESWRFVNGLLDFIRKELGIGTKDAVAVVTEAAEDATPATDELAVVEALAEEIQKDNDAKTPEEPA